MAGEIAMILVIVAVIMEAAIYIKTKSIFKAGYVLEAVLGLVVLVMSATFTDTALLMISLGLLGFGLLLNGVLKLLEK